MIFTRGDGLRGTVLVQVPIGRLGLRAAGCVLCFLLCSVGLCLLCSAVQCCACCVGPAMRSMGSGVACLRAGAGCCVLAAYWARAARRGGWELDLHRDYGQRFFRETLERNRKRATFG